MSDSVLLGLLGENVAGSSTPPMHEAEGARQGIPLVYRPLDPFTMSGPVGAAPGAEPDWARFVGLAADLGFTGLNVTHPAKQAVMPALDSMSDDARLLGAVNTVLFADSHARGENTDHLGFTDAMNAIDVRADAGPVVQVGTGGAGSAVAYALLKAGAPRLHLVDLDASRAQALVARLSEAFDTSRMVITVPEDVPAVLASASGLVNCTPVGMTGVSDGSPVDVSALHPGLWVGDAVYRPLRTTLVRAAEDLGCPAFGGAHMVVGQAVAAFELFTGRPASREAMHATFVDGLN
ncbi:shikimate dehydrogenase [Galactobacter sp.]|uniref:shikimate dehydrogenase n=1 Tax=Galactobacter sp. TaxID=2676125 RepID=UPI0025C07A7D|nr:shikimate dehydrogenase [Galactobacter sp.]